MWLILSGDTELHVAPRDCGYGHLNHVRTGGIVWLLSLAALVVRDIQHFIQYAVMMLAVITPIAYTPTMVPGSLQVLIYVNPLSYFVISMQYLMILNRLPDFSILAPMVGSTIACSYSALRSLGVPKEPSMITRSGLKALAWASDGRQGPDRVWLQWSLVFTSNVIRSLESRTAWPMASCGLSSWTCAGKWAPRYSKRDHSWSRSRDVEVRIRSARRRIS